DVSESIINFYRFWLFWNIFGFIYGLFVAKDYFDWKFLFLSSFSFSLIPLAFFFGKNIPIALNIFRFVLKYLFPFGFLLIPLTFITNEELYSRIMIPVSLFILFIPYLKTKWKILIVLVMLISILMVIDFRTNIIKIGVSLGLLSLYYFKDFIRQYWLRAIHILMFITPLTLFTIGIWGNYDIFANLAEKENYTITDDKGTDENLFSDTRSFLYSEVLSTLKGNGNWFIGESSAGSYHTDWFYDEGGAINDKRYESEVGILNILLRNGIVGVIIYSLLLFTVSYIAINRSNNQLAKILGLYIAFHWALSFIEEYTQYDLNFYFLWLVIGLVSTSSFRSINDRAISYFLRRI
ncbi:MAG: hypothetical protein Q8859_10545, partial [Bacteroidota bacterium]|nr:hypothetical protein [Bacteroidota bacterium]